MEAKMFNMDDILTDDEIKEMFSPVQSQSEEEDDEAQKSSEARNDEKPDPGLMTASLGKEQTPEELFGKVEKDQEEATESQGEEGVSAGSSGASPEGQNVFSSIARALVDEGIFLTLDDDDAINAVETADDFAELFEKEIAARLDDKSRRVSEALDNGVPSDLVKQYEGQLNYLAGISDTAIKAETEQGESIRKMLIYNDWLNHGFSKERAMKEMDKSFKSGTDVEDAVEALRSVTEFYKNKYDELLADNERKSKAERDELDKQVEGMRKSIMEDESFIGGMKVDKGMRKRVYDNITKPVWTAPDGSRLTALQRYEYENRADFLKNVGLLYTITDGFKNIDRIAKSEVNKEKRRGVAQLETLLGGRVSNGSLNYMGNLGKEDKNSPFQNGWRLSK